MGWDGDVFGESAVAIYSDDACVFTDVSQTGTAIATGVTDNMRLERNIIAYFMAAYH
jgi:hypothetical protein